MGPLIADGGLATSLQAAGLPPYHPVDDWLLQRPEVVETAQRAFVDAGAQLLLTGTFRTLPHLRSDWEAVCDAAVRIAATAAGARAAVWGSIGPSGTVDRPWSPGLDGGWGAVGARLAPHVAGFVLETFTSGEEALAALRAVRDLGRPVVTSLAIAPSGAAFDGAPVEPVLDALLAGGATAVGLNCCAPSAVAAVLARWEGPPPWARPGLDPRGGDWVAEAVALAPRCAVIGGCCGVGPAHVRRLARALAEAA